MQQAIDQSESNRIGVCHGSRCADYGGKALAEKLTASGLAFEIIECQSLCPHSPIVRVNAIVKLKANLDKVLESLI